MRILGQTVEVDSFRALCNRSGQWIDRVSCVALDTLSRRIPSTSVIRRDYFCEVTLLTSISIMAAAVHYTIGNDAIPMGLAAITCGGICAVVGSVVQKKNSLFWSRVHLLQAEDPALDKWINRVQGMATVAFFYAISYPKLDRRLLCAVSEFFLAKVSLPYLVGIVFIERAKARSIGSMYSSVAHPEGHAYLESELNYGLQLLEYGDLCGAEKRFTLGLSLTSGESIPDDKRNFQLENRFLHALAQLYLQREGIAPLIHASALSQYWRLVEEKHPAHVDPGFAFLFLRLIPLISERVQATGRELSVITLDTNRQRLENIIQQARMDLQGIAETRIEQEPVVVRDVYRSISNALRKLAGQMILQAENWLGTKPCEYTAICFGSLARDEATPYSDLEYGFLIAEDSEEIRRYFRNLAHLVQFLVICLRRTILRSIDIPAIQKAEFHDCVTMRGFSLDGSGVRGKGCKTPLGNLSNGGRFELIQTPQKMAEYVGKSDSEDQWWYEIEPHLPLELLNTAIIPMEGREEQSRSLHDAFRIAVTGQLDRTLANGGSLREYLAHDHLIEGDLALFAPDRNLRFLAVEQVIHLKNELYRFPQLFLDRLALVHRVTAQNCLDRTTDLINQDPQHEPVFNSEGIYRLRMLFSRVMHWRLKAYSDQDRQCDDFNYLLQRHIASAESQEGLKEIYSTLCGLRVCFGLFREQRLRFFGNQRLVFPSPFFFQGVIEGRFGNYSSAIDNFQRLGVAEPTNLEHPIFVALMQMKRNAPGWQRDLEQAIHRAGMPVNTRRGLEFRKLLNFCLRSQDRNDECLELLQDTITDLERMGEEARERDIVGMRCEFYLELIALYSEMENTRRAKEWIYKTERHIAVLGDRLPNALVMLGKLMYLKADTFSDPSDQVPNRYVREAIALQTRIQRRYRTAPFKGRVDMGKLHMLNMDYRAAEREFLDQLNEAGSLNRPWNSYIRALGNLCKVYLKMGRNTEGLERSREFLQVSIEMYGEEHRKILSPLDMCGEFSERLEQMDTAIDFWLRVISIGNAHSQDSRAGSLLLLMHLRLTKAYIKVCRQKLDSFSTPAEINAAWDSASQHHRAAIELSQIYPPTDRRVQSGIPHLETELLQLQQESSRQRVATT